MNLFITIKMIMFLIASIFTIFFMNNKHIENFETSKKSLSVDKTLTYHRDQLANAVQILRNSYIHDSIYKIFKIEYEATTFTLYYYIFDKLHSSMKKHKAVINMQNKTIISKTLLSPYQYSASNISSSSLRDMSYYEKI